jgi:hypothetical protein
VTTSHASQGKTVDTVLIAQGVESFGASSREQFYVSVSRGKKKALLYTDNKAALKDRIEESGQRASASELLDNDVTARGKPRRIEEELHAARERFRRFCALRAKAIAANVPRLVKDREQESLHERRHEYGAGMER